MHTILFSVPQFNNLFNTNIKQFTFFTSYPWFLQKNGAAGFWMERWRGEHPILARFRVCNVKIHGMGVKMHDGMSWHGTSLYFSMKKSLNDREIRKTYISVSVSSLNIAKNEKPIFLLFRSLIYRKHSGFLRLFLYIETRNERKYRDLSYSFLFVNCYHSFALKSL